MKELENIVDKMQEEVLKRCTKEAEKAKKYAEGYIQGVEDLYRYIRQNQIKEGD